MKIVMFEQLLVDFVIRLFFVFGILALLVGVGLVFSHERMHRLFGMCNRWVSTRRSMRWLEIPRDVVESAAHRFRHLVGACFVLLAAYSTFMLVTQVDARYFVVVLPGGKVSAEFVAWLAESARWALIVGGMVAIAAGAMLAFVPQALRAVEERANRWYSTHNWMRDGDDMRLGFDGWVERRPRVTGSLIAAGALVVVANFGLALLARA